VGVRVGDCDPGEITFEQNSRKKCSLFCATAWMMDVFFLNETSLDRKRHTRRGFSIAECVCGVTVQKFSRVVY
jgi:hypothetical protein